jgi:hypothetical protein
MVGIRGTSDVTNHPVEFDGALHSVVEALDEQAAPANLYEAQLAHRLGRARP